MATAFSINFEFIYKGSEAWVYGRRGEAYLVCYDHLSKITVLTRAEISAAVAQSQPIA